MSRGGRDSDGGYVTAAKSDMHAGRAGSDGTPMNVHPSLNVTQGHAPFLTLLGQLVPGRLARSTHAGGAGGCSSSSRPIRADSSSSARRSSSVVRKLVIDTRREEWPWMTVGARKNAPPATSRFTIRRL